MKKISEKTAMEFSSEYKVGLIATIDDSGCPHITFMSSLQALGDDRLTVGEFITGLSKKFMQERNKAGFLVMSLDKTWWNGKAVWTEKRDSGAEYEKYNRIPMFRYNTYFGIHTVHYFSLEEISEGAALNMGGIIFNAILNILGRFRFKKKSNPRALRPWAEKLLKNVATLKFLSYIDSDGFPVIYPVVQAQACDGGRIVIPASPYAKELSGLKPGMDVALLGANLDMENVLVKGVFSGFKPSFSGKTGFMDINRVYNSLPPKHGYIYP